MNPRSIDDALQLDLSIPQPNGSILQVKLRMEPQIMLLNDRDKERLKQLIFDSMIKFHHDEYEQLRDVYLENFRMKRLLAEHHISWQ